MNVTIGQTLYEPRHRGQGYIEYKVIRIGRKWITLDYGRCTVNGLMRDCGGYSPRKLYTSTDSYETEGKLVAAWADLRRDLQYLRRPDDITVDEINKIRARLGLSVFGGETK